MKFQAIALSAAAAMLLAGCVGLPPSQPEPDAVGLRLPALFSDHAVLQRDRPIPVWGWAAPGGTVAVSIDGGQAARAVAGEDGRWEVVLPARPADGGKPHALGVSGRETVTVSDVVFGDVWLCSGQSNMAFPVSGADNFVEARADADFPLMRHFHVGNTLRFEPADDVEGAWQAATPETVGEWTAVGFFFGRELHRHLGVPIGLVNASWGGTRVETWMSREAYAQLPGGEDDLAKIPAARDLHGELMREYEKKAEAFSVEYRKFEALEQDAAHQAEFASPDLDDSSWEPIEAGVNWEAAGHPGLDGEVWYRRAIEIPESWAGRDLTLSLGAIDEVDTTFFNGVKVGGMGSVKPFNPQYWRFPRRYAVPAALVKPGRAVLAVRVADQSGQGGLWGSPSDLLWLAPAYAEDDASRISLAGEWRHAVAFVLPERPKRPDDPNVATVLFNGMVNGLIPFAIRGAIWYQGENNGRNAWAYRELFPAMIRDWRARWGQGDFPFLWVQLASFRAPNAEPADAPLAVLRESQNRALALPATATALTIDIGAEKDVHPKNKLDVGRRLALAARRVAYGENIVHSGPTFAGMAVEDGAIRIRFDNVGGGLVAKGGPLKRFAIAGEDRKFTWADAAVDGSTVVVRADGVPAPVAVRYAWEANPEGCNLYNAEALPASPFRTDDWPVTTQPKPAR